MWPRPRSSMPGSAACTVYTVPSQFTLGHCARSARAACSRKGRSGRCPRWRRARRPGRTRSIAGRSTVGDVGRDAAWPRRALAASSSSSLRRREQADRAPRAAKASGDRRARCRARRRSPARACLGRSPRRATLVGPPRLGSAGMSARPGHCRRGGVPPDHLLAPGGGAADHRRQHRPRHAGVGADRARDDRPPRGGRLRDPRAPTSRSSSPTTGASTRPDRAPPPPDRALPDRRLRHPLGPGARGGRAARALDVADGRGAHAARDRRRQDLSARPSDLRGRARAGRAARRRRGGRQRARAALRERGRGPAPLPQGHRPAPGLEGTLAQLGRRRDRDRVRRRRPTRSRAAWPRPSRSWPTRRRPPRTALPDQLVLGKERYGR